MSLTGRLIIDIATTELTVEDKVLLKDSAVAGVILFSRNFENPKQMKELVAEVKNIDGDLLLTVDQEGGRVQRFKQGMPALPSNYSLSERERHSAGTIEAAATVMAYSILELGLDLSFAPVVDLYNPHSTVIGDRAFSADPKTVVQYAERYITTMQNSGMAAVVKHFPGHGVVVEDSHSCLPRLNISLEAMQQHIAPFKQLSHLAQAVMVAHLHLPQIDSEITTYSQFWVTELLRQKLQFGGAIFCDDLSMAGASHLSPTDKVTQAIASGCDLLLYCNQRQGVEQVLGSSLNLVCNSELHRTRIANLLRKNSQVDREHYRQAFSKIQF